MPTATETTTIAKPPGLIRAKAAASAGLESQIAYINHSADVVHHYSPAVRRLFDLAVGYIHDAEAAYQSGARAAWVMGLWEVPLLYACDTIPVSFTELGRLGSADSITVAEDHYQIPKETCSMVGAILGEWWLRRQGGIAKVLGFNGACEPFNMAWELVKDEGYDVFRVDTVYLPTNADQIRYEQQVAFLTEELKAAARWLNDGEDIDERRLSFELNRQNRILGKVRRVLAQRLKNPLYIRSLATMYLLMGSGHLLGKPEEFEAVVDALGAELESAELVLPENGKRVVPLLWAGGRGQEFGVYQTIDDCGGAVTGWFTPNAVARNYREDIPPFEALARFFLDGQLSGSVEKRRSVLTQQLQVSGAQGIIFYGYVGCSFGSIHQEMERAHFHAKGVPSISLEGTFQVGQPSGQLLTRIRAFVEMLS